MDKDLLSEYLREKEPDKQYKAYAWATASGLQAVDGLRTSDYLFEVAKSNIEGNTSLEEADQLIRSYYKKHPAADPFDRSEEADLVSVRIAALLSEQAFSLTPNAYLSIHKRLFTGILSHAGRLRKYNITKSEWVLNGDTVLYGSASDLRATLEYDISVEREFSYRGLSDDEIISHIAKFVSRLWQIHVFEEGNTRTTAVFLIKYLRTLGFNATNDVFAQKARYFRDSLVRANYSDVRNGIHETTEYLQLFLRNLLLNEQNTLKSRFLHISGRFRSEMDEQVRISPPSSDIDPAKVDIGAGKVDIDPAKVDIGAGKVDIGADKVDIDPAKVDIEAGGVDIGVGLHNKTAGHVRLLYEILGDEVFGRTEVMATIGIKPSGASRLIKKMVESDIIEPVAGRGKGKYRFRRIPK